MSTSLCDNFLIPDEISFKAIGYSESSSNQTLYIISSILSFIGCLFIIILHIKDRI